jgi:hypothetical protein
VRSDTRTALWVCATTLATAAIAWFFSMSGGSLIWLLLGLQLPWLTPFRETLLLWQAVGLLAAFLLALLVVRLASAPPMLWLGALAAAALLAGPYVTGYLELRLAGADQYNIDRLLYGRPFLDPLVVLVAVVGYPLVIGLGGWLGSRLLVRQAAAQRQESVSHA